MNLANVLRVNAANHGDRTAIRFRGDIISYRGALDIVRALAAQLDAAGIARDDRVGLAMRDHPVHLLAHFAVAWLGAVIVPVDHRWTHAEQRRAAEAFDVKLLLTDDVAIDGVDCITPDPNGEPYPGQPAALSGADVLVSLSSGTTGRPKGALVTHENLYERFVSQWTAIGYDARDCFGLVTPLFFGAGRSFGMSLLTAGGSVMLAPPPIKPPEIAAALADPEVTAAFLPPTLLRRLLPLHEGTLLLGNIDYLIVSGEPLYADEARECREKICPNLVGYYASSEGGGISVLAAADLEAHADTVGIPTFRTEVSIVDGDGRPLGDNQVGRLRYRGPGVATRFLDEDGELQEAAADGWFYPGDLAERQPGGFIALRGRDKEVIIRGGVNVYPAEIERVLTSHSEVREAAVIGIADRERGETIAAFVAGNVGDTAELIDYCREHLAPYKVPATVQVLEALPKKVSGKIDRRALTASL